MPFETSLLIFAGAAAGGFINGLAGFGTALFALGFFLSALPPVQAVGLVLIISFITGCQGLWVVRRAILGNIPRLLWFLLPALCGIYIGVQSLQYVDVSLLKLMVAGFLILYGGFFSLRRALPKIAYPTPWVDATIGLVGGILGGLAALSGALPTMWCAMKDWSKAETRGVLQAYNFVVLTISAIMLFFHDAYTQTTLYASLIAIPTALASAQIGILVFKRLPDEPFRRTLILLCLASGMILMAREVLVS